MRLIISMNRMKSLCNCVSETSLIFIYNIHNCCFVLYKFLEVVTTLRLKGKQISQHLYPLNRFPQARARNWQDKISRLSQGTAEREDQARDDEDFGRRHLRPALVGEILIAQLEDRHR